MEGSLLLRQFVRIGLTGCRGLHRIAVVGSGPAGLFTSASLIRRADVAIDVFDAAPVPFGLVRYGVAPDHQEVKNCINGFNKMFDSSRGNVSLFCNVRIGNDITIDELTQKYDAILLAYGAHRPRRLTIPGAEAANVMSGSDFVSWYNGVPNSKAPLLDSPNIVIVGNGNVALDCARILSTTGEKLRSTDIPSEFVRLLEASKAIDIKILGRRGPSDISFTIKELREQFKVTGWDTSVDIDAAELAVLKENVAKMERKRKRLLQVLLDGARDPSGERNCRFLFHHVPQEVLKDSAGRVTGLRVKNSRTGEESTMNCQLLIYSIGYETLVLEGLPKNEKGGLLMSDECRVNMQPTSGAGVYAAGWCAHGPRGVIVDTQQQSVFVAEQVAKDLKERNSSTGGEGAKALLDSRGVKYVSWEQWKAIDAAETAKGHELGKIREKRMQFD